MMIDQHPLVGDAARRVLEARRRLAACPPHSPLWRMYSVEAEAAWQALHEQTGRHTSAAALALHQAAGEPI